METTAGAAVIYNRSTPSDQSESRTERRCAEKRDCGVINTKQIEINSHFYS